MSGYVMAIGPCFSCGRIFGFSVERVPSLVVDGTREPICRDCVDTANILRAKTGMPEIVPLPGAYEADEA